MLIRAKCQIKTIKLDALEILRLTRTWKNRLAPINRVPPEVLSLVPNFWDERTRGCISVTLTHVCRAWREIFTSCSSLWTDFYCEDPGKTRVYLERSRSSPINLWLVRDDGLFLDDPFLQITPHVVGRLKRLVIRTAEDHLKGITDRLSHPAPLLKDLSICGSADDPESNPALDPTLFDGIFSSLRSLNLQSISTQLPWRNMVHLTSFTLFYVLHPRVSVGQLLDFFESAPRLFDVELHFSTPVSGAQDGRLVSLAHLKKLLIYGFQPSSILLHHLLLPVGADLRMDLDIPGLEVEDYLPGSLDNLRNLSNFNKIYLLLRDQYATMKLTGPNGQVCMTSMCAHLDPTRSVLRSLVQLGASNARRLEITDDNSAPNDLHQALPHMKNLRTLILSRCENLPCFITALNPDSDQTIPAVCPNLKVIVLRIEGAFDIGNLAEVAAARASRGAPLESVGIIRVGATPLSRGGTKELRKHVSHVEVSVDAAFDIERIRSDGGGNDDDDFSNEEEGGESTDDDTDVS